MYSDTKTNVVSDSASFDIGLNPTGDAGSGLHTQNDPAAPYQRENYIERKTAVDIRCSCVDVVHGLLKPDGSSYATLIVLQFRFDPRKRARRISQVDIEIQFSGSEPGAADPEVYAIAPNEHLSVSRITQTETTSTESSLNLGAGSIVSGFVDVGGSVKFGHDISRETNYAATIVGSIDLRGRNYGKANCASWTLIENPATKAGVPAGMRAVILLKRKDEAKFQANVSIRAKADWKTQLEWLVGSTRADDPVLFDPMMEPTSTKYDDMELKMGDINLEAISEIVVESGKSMT
ncbi:hypothetical protein BO94DRAFT_536262 [Aspergillus sclerotioniger CBS 115572]|uniref:Uncharacterized protein n=1 Tax=Aspergillus sclerotioniger CBS 115572 TaxID=1450535 RepID=A0A317WEG6_9EURO|nr:hypothetical protein BO94DRAFT_536262 [Aspergillus sclerotioniger CBS 115572]PWY84669.1 hypothetical protein BO94DRAFT_536262 [Aspergillus sclerotioniger CBS 115572]